MHQLLEPDRQTTRRGRSIWPFLLAISLVALLAVVSFGAGLVVDRQLLTGGWFDRGRLGSGTSGDGENALDAAFPRQAEVLDLIENEYLFLPASPEARATF